MTETYDSENWARDTLAEAYRAAGIEPNAPPQYASPKALPRDHSRSRSEPTFGKVPANLRELLSSRSNENARRREDIFHDGFQSKDQWTAFIGKHLKDGAVATQLSEPASNWTTETFQALFAAAWVHHPTEKGSAMIDLSSLSAAEREQVRTACEKHTKSRVSSHLSSRGGSAAKGFEMLKGYKELLVQYEEIEGQPHLFLKAEGHTTGVTGIVPHTMAYLKKLKTGEGEMRSPALHDLAKKSEGFEARAAENYGKGYSALLDALRLQPKSDKKITVQQVAIKTFEMMGTPASAAGKTPQAFVRKATNAELGAALKSIANSAGGASRGAQLIKELDDLSCSLERDGNVQRVRVYREINATPAELDASLREFRRE